MGLSENEMTVDPDGVADAPGNSIFAAAAGILGVLGLFSIIAPYFAVFSLASIVCGLIVLGLARKGDVARLSAGVAAACVFVGLFCGLAGVTYQMSHDWLVNHKAQEVASKYMMALADGDRALAIKMSGLPPMVEEADEGSGKSSREQKAVRSFLADPAIQAVLKLGKSAAWKSTGLISKTREGMVTEVSIGFIDENATNPRPFAVSVKRLPPTKYTVETRNQWLVDSIDQAPL